MTKNTAITLTLITGVAAFPMFLPGCSTYDPNQGNKRGSLIETGKSKTAELPPAGVKDGGTDILKPETIPQDFDKVNTPEQPAKTGQIVKNTQQPQQATQVQQATQKPVARPAVATEYTTYTVKSGDTAGAIANSHGLTKAEFVALNNIANPDVIKVGQKFKVPAGGKPLPPGPAARPAQAQAIPNDGFKYHVVDKGETLSEIAANYGAKTADVIAWNDLTNPDRIQVGQRLKVSGTKTVVKTETKQTETKQTQTGKPDPKPLGGGTDVIDEPPPPPPPPPPPAASASTYTVKAGGEYFYAIYNNIYETNPQYSIGDIKNANPGISVTELIPAGTEVKLPK